VRMGGLAIGCGWKAMHREVMPPPPPPPPTPPPRPPPPPLMSGLGEGIGGVCSCVPQLGFAAKPDSKSDGMPNPVCDLNSAGKPTWTTYGGHAARCAVS